MRELTDLEFDILWILADNKGHALWELVKLLGKEKSNLIIVLSRLEEEIELTDLSKIGYYDTANMTSLGLEINKANDPLSKYIKERLEPNTVRLMNSNPENFSCGYFELDRLLNDPDLYDETRFANVALSEKTLDIINTAPTGIDLRCLNRKLLEEAYPGYIMKGMDSIICRGPPRKTTNPFSRQPKHLEIPYIINTNLLVTKFLIMTLNFNIDETFPENKAQYQNKLNELNEKVRWQLISEDEYEEAKMNILIEDDDDLRLENTQKKLNDFNIFLSSQYLLQYVKKYGFRWTVYRIHEMVRSWDQCWPLGESAIKNGAVTNDDDLECARKLIRYHQDVEEGFRRMEKMDKDDDSLMKT